MPARRLFTTPQIGNLPQNRDGNALRKYKFTLIAAGTV
jgi:hypothetical protein